ncbi:hypothetical protein [Treponema sp.]|uniref:hypothetical protein n=1 Tax=Treponema sp. TaxID=166 RepID=UPI003FA1C9C7
MKNALLVPGVFFLNFLSGIVVLAFFGGLGVRYEFTGTGAASAAFLFLCIAQSLCRMLPIVTMFAIIGVYAFLMRHRAKTTVAVSLFVVCLVFTVTVIMPVCYAQAETITASLNAFALQPTADRALTGFLTKPLFLTAFIHVLDVLFQDIYTLYKTNFAYYLVFIGSYFFCVTSFWIFCLITQWSMFNLLCIFVSAGGGFLLYPVLHSDVVQALLHNLHLASNESVFGIPLTLNLIAVVLHSAGILLVLIRFFKNKKRRAA